MSYKHSSVRLNFILDCSRLLLLVSLKFVATSPCTTIMELNGITYFWFLFFGYKELFIPLQLPHTRIQVFRVVFPNCWWVNIFCFEESRRTRAKYKNNKEIIFFYTYHRIRTCSTWQVLTSTECNGKTSRIVVQRETRSINKYFLLIVSICRWVLAFL